MNNGAKLYPGNKARKGFPVNFIFKGMNLIDIEVN